MMGGLNISAPRLCDMIFRRAITREKEIRIRSKEMIQK